MDWYVKCAFTLSAIYTIYYLHSLLNQKESSHRKTVNLQNSSTNAENHIIPSTLPHKLVTPKSVYKTSLKPPTTTVSTPEYANLMESSSAMRATFTQTVLTKNYNNVTIFVHLFDNKKQSYQIDTQNPPLITCITSGRGGNDPDNYNFL